MPRGTLILVFILHDPRQNQRTNQHKRVTDDNWNRRSRFNGFRSILSDAGPWGTETCRFGEEQVCGGRESISRTQASKREPAVRKATEKEALSRSRRNRESSRSSLAGDAQPVPGGLGQLRRSRSHHHSDITRNSVRPRSSADFQGEAVVRGMRNIPTRLLAVQRNPGYDPILRETPCSLNRSLRASLRDKGPRCRCYCLSRGPGRRARYCRAPPASARRK